jgi:hypothetical protein
MKIEIIEKIMRMPEQTEETLTDVFSLLLGVEDRKSVDHYVRWVRAEAMKLKTAAEVYELLHESVR